jgi:phosphatidylglycerophosphate synthase
MVWGQQVRAAALGPLLSWLARIGVTADHLTGASLVFGLAFCPLWLWSGGPPWAKPAALVALLIHVLLDGLDGPLARYMNGASRRGSFTDTVADQIVVTATTLAVMAAPQAALSILIGGLYVFVYAMVVGFAMIRNALSVPYSWLVRPRFWVYGWIAVDAYLLPGWMNVVVGAFVVLLAWKMATGFVAIRKML